MARVDAQGVTVTHLLDEIEVALRELLIGRLGPAAEVIGAERNYLECDRHTKQRERPESQASGLSFSIKPHRHTLLNDEANELVRH